MPGKLQAVPGTNTIYAVRQMEPVHNDNTLLWRIYWPNGNRGPSTVRGPWTYDGGLWPTRRGILTGGDSMLQRSLYEPFSIDDRGTGMQKVVLGTTLDSTGAALGNCVVQLFRTSDDLFIMEVTSDANGVYEINTRYHPDTHYLVAYKAGGTDVFGTTANTIVGTNRDGT